MTHFSPFEPFYVTAELFKHMRPITDNHVFFQCKSECDVAYQTLSLKNHDDKIISDCDKCCEGNKQYNVRVIGGEGVGFV